MAKCQPLCLPRRASSTLTLLAAGADLGLAIYGGGSDSDASEAADSEPEASDDSDAELAETIRRRQQAFSAGTEQQILARLQQEPPAAGQPRRADGETRLSVAVRGPWHGSHFCRSPNSHHIIVVTRYLSIPVHRRKIRRVM